MLLSKYSVLAALTLSISASAAVIGEREEVALHDANLIIRAAKATTTTTKTSSSSTSTSKSSSSSNSTSKSSSSSTSSTSTKTSTFSSTTSLSSSLTSTTSSSSSSTSLIADPSCSNTPSTRQCWGDGFSIATDYDTSWPVTGNKVSYNLEITNTTFAPDGFSRLGLLINGQYPGPAIEANWGDTLQITVKNSMADNATGIHWHGIRQMNSSISDGTNGITECPIPPGSSKTYTFLCTQFGTSWYHSHYTAQYGDGVVGPIVIHGPATANYDVDLGAMPITDWYHTTAFALAARAASGGAPPVADNGLINGTMVSPSGTGGAYNTVTLTAGKKYRLRLINTSLDNHFKVHLDGHNLTVIQADFVPTEPYNADWLFIGIGERYDVIITADQTVSNYWFRAEVQAGCGSNANNGNIMAIFSYAGAAAGNPTTTASTYTQSCTDETGLIPYVVKNVPSDQFIPQSKDLDINFTTSLNSNGQNVVQWNVNASSIDVDWEKPTLDYVETDNTSYPVDLNLIELPTANVWSFWIIQASTALVAVPHPIHLHGHDFYLLGSGTGTFSDPTTLQYANPPRRDVAMLPAAGWLVIGFLTDNPGAWLMHCHIAWHVGEGLAVQFLERKSEIPTTFSLANLDPECAAYDDYYATAYYKKIDSGL